MHAAHTLLCPKSRKIMAVKALYEKLLAMLIAAGVMTCASVAPAMAAPTVDDSAKVNVGKKAEVAVADNAKVNVDEKIAIGIGANAKGAYSVAIGNNAVVTGLGELLLDTIVKVLRIPLLLVVM